MRRGFGAAGLASVGLASLLSFAEPATANVVIAIDKASQRMAVIVDGKQEYLWKVSTGTGGAPKAGTYQPQRLEKSWFSRKYDMSPMPHSIFFHEGIAIHGTQYVSRLGTIASHGCVRLHPANAATLFKLVQSQGKGATTIVITHSGWPDLAKLSPKQEPRQAEPKQEAKPELKLQAAPESKQPERALLEHAVETPPGSTGALLTVPPEPPALASAGSEPVKLPAAQQ